MGSCLRQAIVLVGFAVVGSCVEGGSPPSNEAISPASAPVATVAAEPVLREILAEMESPPGAPGRRLSLVRYTIAPGTDLAVHTHPGVQLASIVSGTLSYEVISEAATVYRASNDAQQAGASELIGPVQTTLGPGDVVIERAEMVHLGANRTDNPIVILATLLTDPSQELAVAAPAAQ